VRLDNSSGDRETESNPAPIRRARLPVSVEQMLLISVRNSGALIGDLEHHAITVARNA
jgi:hypothetical protein